MSEHVRHELAEFLVGALAPDDEERVAEHVASCTRCGEELARLHALEGSLASLRLARPARPSTSLRKGGFLAAAALAGAACLAGLLLRGEPRLDTKTDASPFQVRTPRGTAVALGRAFSVEVEGDMNAKVPTVAAVVTITVVSGAILWKSSDGLPDTRVKAGEQAVARLGSVEVRNAPAQAAPRPEAEVARLAKENEVLRKQLAEVTRRAATLEERAAVVGSVSRVADGEPAAPSREAPAPPRRIESPLRFHFGPQKGQDALSKVTNWKELAEACRTLGPIIKQLVALQAKGEEAPPDLLKKVMSENSKLVGLAAAVHGAFPTHAPGNGEYTHPVVLANLMSKQLELASVPLDDAQIDAVARVGGEFDERYAQLQSGYTDQTLELEKILDELELKKLSVDRIVAIFRPEQQAALFDPETKDVYAVDLYSPFLMLIQRVVPVAKATTADLTKGIAKAWLRQWDLDDQNLDALAATFVADVAPAPIPAAEIGRFRIDDAIRAGRATVKAMKDALRTMALDADAAKGITKEGYFAIPRLTAGSK